MDRKAISSFSYWRSGDSESVRRYAVAYAGAVVKRVEGLGVASFIAKPEKDLFERLDLTGTACWNPSFGLANVFAKQGAKEAAAGQLFLALAELGFEGEYETIYPFPVRHRLGAQWFSGSKLVQMTASNGATTVMTDDISLTVMPGDPQYPDEVTEGLFGCGWIKWGYAVDPFILEPGDVPLGQESSHLALERLSEASELLSVDPRVHDWCSRLLCELSLTSSRSDHRLTSRSNPLQPGNVQLSVPGPALHLAELLVHEAAHQHFFLAAMAGPYIASESRHVTAYSALRGCERPIDRILLGLHALLNIAEFLVLHAEAGGRVSQHAVARIDELAPTIRSLKSPFSVDPGLLSQTGRDLLGNGLSRLDDILDIYASPSAASAVQELNA